jgi:hypothetical protein
MRTPPPLATIGVTPTYGSGYGRYIGGAIRWFTATAGKYRGFKDAPVNHAVIFVGDVPGFDKPQLVEMQPSGARFRDWDHYGDQMIWLLQMEQDWCITLQPTDPMRMIYPSDAQRKLAASTAIDLVCKHIGYNFLEFFALALAAKRVGLINPDKPPLWARYLASNKHMDCSQAADYCWAKAGLHIFKNRIPGMVTPEDLYLAGGCPTHPAEK